MEPLRCVIVDDEPLAVKMLENYVARTPALTLAASFTDPVEAISRLAELQPHLLFLDIQMPDLDGLSLSRMVPAQTRIIFTTAFKQYAFESYEVSALDFLLKPIRYQKFLEAVGKAQQWFSLMEGQQATATTAATVAAGSSLDRQSFFVKVDGKMRKVDIADIRYVEGMKDYVLLHLASEPQALVTHNTMKSMEDQLPADRFMRVHRSFIVALDKIDSVTRDGDILIAGRLIPVTDTYRPAFDAYLQKHSLR
jgi:DNA-binding LytR/AlgR family response regulator